MNQLRILSVGWLMLAFAVCAGAQRPVCWDDFAEWIYSAWDDEERANEDILEELYELHVHPFNLNDMADEQLEALMFLSDSQIKDIQYYVERNKPLASTGELMAVESLDAVTRTFLQLFCYAGDVPERNMPIGTLLKYSDNELVVRTDVPFYTKSAYREYSAEELEKSPNKAYRGNRLYQSMRYSFKATDRLEAGIRMEKDAGEKGADYVSGYAVMRNWGILRTAALGNYRLSFGQGLVMNTSLTFGKTMTLGSLGRMDRGIVRHSSMSETGYLSGAAATLGNDRWLFTAFLSHRNADGTMLKDSSGISSLKTDGMHRTPLEHSKKGNLGVTDWGGNIRFSYKAFDFSVTAAATHYSLPLMPKSDTPSSLYRLYNARGTDFSAYSVAYAYQGNRISVRGETAVSSEGGAATINTLQMALGDYNNLTVIQRSYGARYVAVNARSFGDNSRPQNESGLFVGWNTSMWRRIKIEAYVDAAYFPWMKYKVSGSSYSAEGMMQVVYAPQRNCSLALRYRVRARQQDGTTDGVTVLRYLTSHNLRLQCVYAPSKRLTLKTVATAVASSFASTGTETGFLVSENVRWHWNTGKGRIDLSFIYFDTDSYTSRIYGYEPSLLYVYGFSAYFYRGVRASVLATVPLGGGLSATAKLGGTRYFNRSSIGTGTEMIFSAHREDLQMQLRWRF
ncbi:MAG: hypothetical protein NC206_10585 [Bacteroides sp.]|nr:hypothetical protein [Roseburia sp.]MCM1347514.1 hypothetical protein [Bacteroides sp.]MCM1421961.1 hypothetical protein [Bacteroides sp.]